MVRLVLVLSPFIIIIVVTLAVFRCPEGSMVQLAGGVRRADHLAAVVDTQSFAEPATRESAEVDHHPVFNQKSMQLTRRSEGRGADNLAAVVASGSAPDAAP